MNILRYALPLALGLAVAAPALAQDINTRNWTTDDARKSALSEATPPIEAGEGRVVISVSGKSGGDTAAYARWHFAQDGDREGARRFAAD